MSCGQDFILPADKADEATGACCRKNSPEQFASIVCNDLT